MMSLTLITDRLLWVEIAIIRQLCERKQSTLEWVKGKYQTEWLLNQDRCITVLPKECVEDSTTLSTVFMTEYTQAQLKSSLI